MPDKDGCGPKCDTVMMKVVSVGNVDSGCTPGACSGSFSTDLSSWDYVTIEWSAGEGRRFAMQDTRMVRLEFEATAYYCRGPSAHFAAREGGGDGDTGDGTGVSEVGVGDGDGGTADGDGGTAGRGDFNNAGAHGLRIAVPSSTRGADVRGVVTAGCSISAVLEFVASGTSDVLVDTVSATARVAGMSVPGGDQTFTWAHDPASPVNGLRFEGAALAVPRLAVVHVEVYTGPKTSPSDALYWSIESRIPGLHRPLVTTAPQTYTGYSRYGTSLALAYGEHQFRSTQRSYNWDVWRGSMLVALEDEYILGPLDIYHGQHHFVNFSVGCAADHHVVNHTCVPCPPGTTNAAGDDDAGPDTSCDVIQCGPHEHVYNHTCVPCPPGSVNGTNGSNATGPDTNCTAMICGVNEAVQDHVCVPCPGNTTRPAGDDATGNNTRCDGTCTDGLLTGDETYVDCGGSCPRCRCTPVEIELRTSHLGHALGGSIVGPGPTVEIAPGSYDSHSTYYMTVCLPYGEHVLRLHLLNSYYMSGYLGHMRLWSNEPYYVYIARWYLYSYRTEYRFAVPGGCAADHHVVNHTCVPCPPGTANAAGDDDAGPDTSCDVIQCGPHEHVYNHTCVPCPPGSVNGTNGSNATGPDTNCTAMICGVNEAVQDHVCVPCPGNTTRPAGDDATGNNTRCDGTCTDGLLTGDETYVDCGGSCPRCRCTPVEIELRTSHLGHALGGSIVGPGPTVEIAPGSYDSYSTYYMTVCLPYGEHVLRLHLLNSYYMSGYLGHMRLWSNEPYYVYIARWYLYSYRTEYRFAVPGGCAADHHVVNHTCVPCPPGTTNAAGDDDAGPDTSCDVIQCGPHEHVYNHTCVPCPPGSVNGTNGSNATGPDTNCTAMICGVNEAVQDHVCVPCPGNTTRPAGDDATGNNTRCDGTCTDGLLTGDETYVDCGGSCPRCRCTPVEIELRTSHLGHALGGSIVGTGPTVEIAPGSYDSYSTYHMTVCLSSREQYTFVLHIIRPDTTGHLATLRLWYQNTGDFDYFQLYSYRTEYRFVVPGGCAADHHVVNHTCVPCPPGTTNAAGDDDAGPDTSCDVIQCGPHEHVYNHKCVPCPPGSMGSETNCNPMICGVNEAVQDHVCVPCPGNTTRPAGDDATGNNTRCDGTCTDGLLTGDETYVDCGGSCPRCRCTPVEIELRTSHLGHALGGSIVGPGPTVEIAPGSYDSHSTYYMTVCLPYGEHVLHLHLLNSYYMSGYLGHMRLWSNEPYYVYIARWYLYSYRTEYRFAVPGGCAADHHVVNHTCVPCPPGTTNAAGDDDAGPDTSCDVIQCGPHEHVYNHTCVPCPPGSVNGTNGSNATGPDTNCTAMICGVNEAVQDHVCVPCPGNTTRPAGDDATGNNTRCDGTCTDGLLTGDETYVDCGGSCPRCRCTPVEIELRTSHLGHALGGSIVGPGPTVEIAPGSYDSYSTYHMTVCLPYGEHVLRLHLLNSYYMSGYLGHMRLWSNEPYYVYIARWYLYSYRTEYRFAVPGGCAADHHVVNHTCVPCPPGTTNAAGDDDAGPDTSCDVIQCGPHEHVYNHTCVPCPPGSVNGTNGSNATGPDTNCTAMICGVNEAVQDHVCVPCPGNTTRPAGDDATGPNTFCNGLIGLCPMGIPEGPVQPGLGLRYAFDRLGTTSLALPRPPSGGAWVQITFPRPVYVETYHVAVAGYSRDVPRSWRLEGRGRVLDWRLDVSFPVPRPARLSFDVARPGAYTAYRLHVLEALDHRAHSVRIAEFDVVCGPRPRPSPPPSPGLPPLPSPTPAAVDCGAPTHANWDFRGCQSGFGGACAPACAAGSTGRPTAVCEASGKWRYRGNCGQSAPAVQQIDHDTTYSVVQHYDVAGETSVKSLATYTADVTVTARRTFKGQGSVHYDRGSVVTCSAPVSYEVPVTFTRNEVHVSEPIVFTKEVVMEAAVCVLDSTMSVSASSATFRGAEVKGKGSLKFASSSGVLTLHRSAITIPLVVERLTPGNRRTSELTTVYLCGSQLGSLTLGSGTAVHAALNCTANTTYSNTMTDATFATGSYLILDGVSSASQPLLLGSLFEGSEYAVEVNSLEPQASLSVEVAVYLSATCARTWTEETFLRCPLDMTCSLVVGQRGGFCTVTYVQSPTPSPSPSPTPTRSPPAPGATPGPSPDRKPSPSPSPSPDSSGAPVAGSGGSNSALWGLLALLLIPVVGVVVWCAMRPRPREERPHVEADAMQVEAVNQDVENPLSSPVEIPDPLSLAADSPLGVAAPGPLMVRSPPREASQSAGPAEPLTVESASDGQGSSDSAGGSRHADFEAPGIAAPGPLMVRSPPREASQSAGPAAPLTVESASDGQGSSDSAGGSRHAGDSPGAEQPE